MSYNLISDLANNGVLGIILALAITAIAFLYKRNQDLEKNLNDEIRDREKNDTYVIKSIDSTMKAILIDLEKENHDR